jgi:hypothetical protein
VTFDKPGAATHAVTHALPFGGRLAVLLLVVSLAATSLALIPASAVRAADDDRIVATFRFGVDTEPVPIPEPEIINLRPRPKPGLFSMNLYSDGDFAHQRTVHWCVAASVQTMVNIIEEDEPDRSKASQRRLHMEGRSLDPGHAAYWAQLDSDSPLKDGLHGLGLVHWVDMLDASGHGPFELDRALTRKQAMRKAARAMRITGKPVGLVVWKGAHAWVMSGFKATADPAYTDDFKVTEVYLQDPWYPSVSGIWGASRPPNSLVPVADLDADYLPYDRPGRQHPKRDGEYMLILPTLPEGTVVA